MVTEFCNKFLEEASAMHITDLGRLKEKSGEDLVPFIKWYKDGVLQWRETLLEPDLVYRCIKNVENGS